MTVHRSWTLDRLVEELHPREPSLLANLVDVPLRETSTLWDASVLSGAEPQDRSALQRARQVAALSAVGRGVYAALVEELRANDGRPTEKLHRGYLKVVVEKYREEALALNVTAVRDDAPAYVAATRAPGTKAVTT